MKTRHIAPAFALLFSVAAATAHTGAMGVTLERMQAMTSLADAMKSLAPMVLRGAEHDAAVVRAAGEVILSHAGADTVALFEEGTHTAPSEASPAIWEDAAGFAALFVRMRSDAEALIDGADSPDRTAQTFAALGQTCIACHEDFRIERD